MALLRVLSLADQILFSAANFVLTLILARYFSEQKVEAYGIALFSVLILQGVQRTSYILQNAVLPAPIFRRRARRVLGQHLIFLTLLTLAVLLISGALFLFPSSKDVWAILYATAACAMIYMHLDFDRLCLVKHDRYFDSFIFSALYFVLIISSFFAVSRLGMAFSVLMGVMGVYGASKLLRLICIVGFPDFFWGWAMFKKSVKEHFTGSVLGIAGSAGFGSAPLFALSALAPSAQAAAYVVTRSLLQPVNVIARSLDVIDKNVFQAGQGTSLFRLKTILLKQLAIYGIFGAITIAGTLAFGEMALHILYGEKYDDFQGILIGWAVFVSLMSVMFPLETAVTKTGRLRAYNIWKLPAGATGIILAVLLCPSLGAGGAIIAAIGGATLCLAASLWLIRDVLCASGEQPPSPSA